MLERMLFRSMRRPKDRFRWSTWISVGGAYLQIHVDTLGASASERLLKAVGYD